MTLSLLLRKKKDYDLVVLGITGTESKGKRFKTMDKMAKFSKIDWALLYT